MDPILENTWTTLLRHYDAPNTLSSSLWQEIHKKYSSRGRHYHDLTHLSHLLKELSPIRSSLHDWHAIRFSIYYHDIIYNARRSDNEEKSALLAGRRMQELAVPPATIEKTLHIIRATRQHLQSPDGDTNYFLDADLSTLGQPWEVYRQYFKNIRKEYSIYPDLLYIPGRRKVLNHFLDMPRIFKTEYFSSKYEEMAKANLRQELQLL